MIDGKHKWKLTHSVLRVKVPHADLQAVRELANQERTSVSAIVRRKLLEAVRDSREKEN